MTKKQFFTQVLKQEYILKEKKNLEKIPDGFLLSGFDFKMAKPIVALNEICGVRTQWSCQGHDDSGWDYAYIRLAENSKLPPSFLLEELEKNGHTWEPKMIVLGRGESKVFALKNQNISQIRLVNNKKIAYKTSFYNQQSEIMEAVALFSPDAGESIPWSQKASSFTFSPTFIMKTIFVQGMVSSNQSLYVLIKEDSSENSVTTSRNEVIKIDNEGIASVLFSDLSSNVKNILNTSPSGQSIHFGTMAFLKGGIVMTTYGGSNSAILYRLRLDNGEMEVIKNDFYYNTYDGKSVNWMFKLNDLNKIIIGGEDSTTNGIYTKMFILE